jgi:hypothetical protein
MTSERATGDERPRAARTVGRTLVLAGVWTAIVQGIRLLLFGMRPLAIAVGGGDAELVTAAIHVLVAVSLWGLVTLMPGVGGIALLAGNRWARSLVVCGTLAALIPFASSAQVQQALGTTGWSDVSSTGDLLARIPIVVVPLIASIALLVFGRAWSPPARLGRWVVTAAVVALFYGTLPWVEDPSVARLIALARERPRPPSPSVPIVGATPKPPPPSVEPGRGRLVIVPTYDGRRFDSTLDVPVRIDLDETRTQRSRSLKARMVDGEIDLSDVDTGVWYARFGIDVNRDNDMGSAWGMPGDFVRIGTEPLELLRDGQTLRTEIDVYRLLRLLEPDDTEHGVARRSGDYRTFHSPVRFRWEAVPGATSYAVKLTAESPRGRKVAPERTIADATVTQTTWTADVAPNSGDEVYAFVVTANGKRGALSAFQIHGLAWFGFDYRFRVVPPDVPIEPVHSVEAAPPVAASDTARLVIVPTLDGRPFKGFDRTTARVVLFADDTAVRSPLEDVVVKNGAIELSDLPTAAYRVRLLLDLDPLNALAMPGDCEGTYPEGESRLTLASGRTTRVEVPVECLIRLTAPEDTGMILSPHSAEPSSPVTFAWKPVPGAVRYHYRIVQKDGDGEHVVAEGDTPETTWSPALDPSPPRAQYIFTLSAHGEHEQVGRLQVSTGPATGVGVGVAPSYYFRVPGGDVQSGNGHLTIVPTYDGQPLDPSLAMPVELTLNESGRKESRKFAGRLAHGEIEIADVPAGVYRVSFMLDLTHAGTVPAGTPRQLFAAHSPELRILRDGQSVRHEMGVYRTMEFVQPPPELSTKAELLALRSPVTLAWERVDGATGYELSLTRFGTPGDRFDRRDTTTRSTWSGDLAATEPGQFYWFSVVARGERAPIAENFCRFRVE